MVIFWQLVIIGTGDRWRVTNKQKWPLPARNVLRDGVDDSRKSLDIPAQEACSNVPISKSMCSFPVPMITNCQNITINYTIFPRKWLSIMSLHTFLLYCHSCWIYCLLLKFGELNVSINSSEHRLLGEWYYANTAFLWSRYKLIST
jgi:hypothetical protein